MEKKESRVGTFKIYNLSQDIEVGSEIELWFGYESRYWILF